MPTKLAALAAYLIGVGGASLFFAYVLATGAGILSRVGDAPGGVMPWAVNVGLLLLCAAQHSGMARQSFKQWITRWIPPTLERSLYVAASGVAIALLTVCWQPLSGDPIWHGPLWIAAISVLAALGLTCCCAWFDHAAFLGLTPAWTGNAPARGPLCIDGPYRYVRHPLMLGVLIALWAQPIMPPELLMMNGGWTIYILIAIWLEERDLLRDYGAEYEAYRKKVPALIPFLW
jgi:protein-S-isoprenylcysteine O-methyltransferase Ste14